MAGRAAHPVLDRLSAGRPVLDFQATAAALLLVAAALAGLGAAWRAGRPR